MRRTALLAAVLLLPACGEDVRVERTSQAEQRSTPSAAPTPSPTRAPSPEPELPTPPAEPSAEPAQAAPTTAPSKALKTAAQGDVDGDGAADEISVDENLVVLLSSTGKAVGSAFETDTGPVPSGSEDVDRDGRAEVFLRTGQGASTTFLTPFRYDGRTFAPLTLDGEQVKLGVGGSATHGDGFTCTEQGTLLVRSAVSDDGGTTFTVTGTSYRIEGHRLVQERRTTGTTTGEDPAVGMAYVVDCRSVGEGG